MPFKYETEEQRKAALKASAKKYRDRVRDTVRAKGREYAAARRSRFETRGLCNMCGLYPPSPDLKTCFTCRKRHYISQRENLVREVLTYYCDGEEPFCKCCGENNWRFLTLDHPNNDGAEHRKQVVNGNHSREYYKWLKHNNYPIDLDVMCMNCNWGRARDRRNHICPHQEAISLSDVVLNKRT